MYIVLLTDSSPWSAIRGSPELRAYSSMPRGSVPWSQRKGGGGKSVRGARSATTGEGQQTIPRQPVNATVHLVDTCGLIIDICPVLEASALVAANTSLPILADSVQRPNVCGSAVTTGPEDDGRHKHAASHVISRAHEDLKHIPPGKQVRYASACGSQMDLKFNIIYTDVKY